MRALFWVCLALIAYAYLGYLVLLLLLVRIRRRAILKRESFPSVSIIMAVRNEEKNLPVKLQNLRELKYPQDGFRL